MRHEVMKDLLRRYGQVFRLAWQERGQARALPRHETEFLPAALALRDTPVHPAPRVAMWLILLFAASVLGWSVFGYIDIVASAQGKVIPDARSKVVQPLETATVAAIRVRDGQHVEAGDLLIALDDVQERAEVARLAEALEAARWEALRAQALLRAVDGGPLALPLGLPAGSLRHDIERPLLEGEYAAYLTRLKQLDAQIERQEAELRGVEQMLARLEQTLPMISARAEDYRRLQAENFISRHGWLEKEQARVEAERDLAAQREKHQETAAAMRESRRLRAALVAETRRTALDRQREAQRKANELEQEYAKAARQREIMRLTAPVSGTVQQLAVHTVGGVVTPAQSLLVVVPDDNPLEVEAFLENKDVGFVHPGQSVEVKVDAFPFTRYGTLAGTVTQVSHDAIQDEKRGLVFAMRVKLARSTLDVDGQPLELTPGMAVRVEIKTGRRLLMEYFLSPLLQYGSESFRER